MSAAIQDVSKSDLAVSVEEPLQLASNQEQLGGESDASGSSAEQQPDDSLASSYQSESSDQKNRTGLPLAGEQSADMAALIQEPTAVDAARTSIYSNSQMQSIATPAAAGKPQLASLFVPPAPQATQTANLSLIKPQTSNNGPAAEVEEHQEDEPAGLMKLISAPGMARMASNGLWVQTDRVDTHCFKPDLINLIHQVEKHYGKPAVVTSGYRNLKDNRKAGGSSFSRHTTCDAADIQVADVSKWDLAEFLRGLPNRGGVGTYCYTRSVHIDTGSQRDWNWRCRRKKK